MPVELANVDVRDVQVNVIFGIRGRAQLEGVRLTVTGEEAADHDLAGRPVHAGVHRSGHEIIDRGRQFRVCVADVSSAVDQQVVGILHQDVRFHRRDAGFDKHRAVVDTFCERVRAVANETRRADVIVRFPVTQVTGLTVHEGRIDRAQPVAAHAGDVRQRVAQVEHRGLDVRRPQRVAVAVFVDIHRCQLGRRGMNRGVVVIAVGGVVDQCFISIGRTVPGLARGIAVAILVGIRVERRLVDRVHVVGIVAVAVDPVITVLLGRGMDERFGVVAVGHVRDIAIRHIAGVDRGQRIAVAVFVSILIPDAGVDSIQLCITVTVPVDRVTALVGTGVHIGVHVIALFAGEVPVGITVDRPNGAVAVVVIRVGAVGLVGTGVILSITVVTVVSSCHEAFRLRTAHGHDRVVAVAVFVYISVPRGLIDRIHVDIAVTVVVDLVTDLVGAGVNRRIAVIAVLVGIVAITVFVDHHHARIATIIGTARVHGPRVGSAVGDMTRVMTGVVAEGRPFRPRLNRASDQKKEAQHGSHSCIRFVALRNHF